MTARVSSVGVVCVMAGLTLAACGGGGGSSSTGQGASGATGASGTAGGYTATLGAVNSYLADSGIPYEKACHPEGGQGGSADACRSFIATDEKSLQGMIGKLGKADVPTSEAKDNAALVSALKQALTDDDALSSALDSGSQGAIAGAFATRGAVEAKLVNPILHRLDPSLP